jgi:hypothetical protein
VRCAVRSGGKFLNVEKLTIALTGSVPSGSEDPINAWSFAQTAQSGPPDPGSDRAGTLDELLYNGVPVPLPASTGRPTFTAGGILYEDAERPTYTHGQEHWAFIRFDFENGWQIVLRISVHRELTVLAVNKRAQDAGETADRVPPEWDPTGRPVDFLYYRWESGGFGSLLGAPSEHSVPDPDDLDRVIAAVAGMPSDPNRWHDGYVK